MAQVLVFYDEPFTRAFAHAFAHASVREGGHTVTLQITTDVALKVRRSSCRPSSPGGGCLGDSHRLRPG